MRLVGLRHDVQLWDQDRRRPSNPFNRRYQPLLTSAQIAAGLAGASASAVAGIANVVGAAATIVGAAGLADCERQGLTFQHSSAFQAFQLNLSTCTLLVG